MSFIEIFLICIFSIFQSIFGIGILILGTPTFLLLGYSYFETLNILLPFSIAISLLQIITTKKKNYSFLVNLFLFSIPMLILGLILANYIQSKFNFKIIVAIFLIVSSIINLIKVEIKLSKLFNFFSFGFLGFVQGISNLGGAILSLIANNLAKEKNLVRFYIAIGYLIFAIMQFTIVNIFFDNVNLSKLYFIWLPILTYFIANKLFGFFDNKIYSISINILIFFYGIYLMISL